MSIEKDRDADERSPRYRVCVYFKKTLYFGDRFSTTCHTYTTTNTKAAIVKQLYNAGGLWTAEETLWVPCDMFAYIEFQREHQ